MSKFTNKRLKESEEKEETRTRLKDIALLLVFPTLITAIISIILNLVNLTESIKKFINQNNYFLTIEVTHLLVNIFNIIVSFIAAIFFLKIFNKSSFLFPVKKYSEQTYKKITDYEAPELTEKEIAEKIKNNPIRVENLVRQYLLFITLFAFSLVAVYSAIIISSVVKLEEGAQFKQEVKKIQDHINETEKKLLVENAISFIKNTEDEKISEPTQKKLEVKELKFKERRDISAFEFLVNVINFSGAIFIYLGFRVLHDKTLRPNHSSYDDFWVYPVCFSTLYLLVMGMLYLGFVSNNRDATIFLNITDLIAGVINGLAMALLFGRYVSIEQSVKNSNITENLKVKWLFINFSYKTFSSNIIIFVLPVYALAQILFGALTIDAFGETKVFQTMVYLFCLIGKIFFFAITYLIIKKKLLALYLHGVVAEVGNYKELEECLNFDSNKSSAKERD